jgi:hypothetical protein
MDYVHLVKGREFLTLSLEMWEPFCNIPGNGVTKIEETDV